MQWKVESILRAVDWGWTVKASKFIPVLTDLKAPFQSILKIIRCQCKTDCSSRRCGCQKNNLPCTYVYCSCLERNCRNIENTCVFSDDEENWCYYGSKHRTESTLTLLPAKNTDIIH